jgi:hypothetical protein
MSEEREGGSGLSDASKQINLLRMASEEMASFERARSVAGALFQVGLAEDTAVHLRDLDLSEERTVRKLFDKLISPLDSVSLLLRDECPAEDYETARTYRRWQKLIDQKTRTMLRITITKPPAPEAPRSQRSKNEARWLRSAGSLCATKSTPRWLEKSRLKSGCKKISTSIPAPRMSAVIFRIIMVPISLPE